MTIFNHIEMMQRLLRDLDKLWVLEDGKVKATWLAMVAKLAKELEAIALAEPAESKTSKSSMRSK